MTIFGITLTVPVFIGLVVVGIMLARSLLLKMIGKGKDKSGKSIKPYVPDPSVVCAICAKADGRAHTCPLVYPPATVVVQGVPVAGLDK